MSAFIESTRASLEEAFTHTYRAVDTAVSKAKVWIGREIRRLTNETIPYLVQEVQSVSKDALTNLFWLVPYVAFVCGNYADSAVCGVVALASGLDAFLDDEESSKTIALLVGGPLAVNIAVRTIRFVVTGNSFHAVSLLFHCICMAKLALIAKGLNK